MYWRARARPGQLGASFDEKAKVRGVSPRLGSSLNRLKGGEFSGIPELVDVGLLGKTKRLATAFDLVEEALRNGSFDEPQGHRVLCNKIRKLGFDPDWIIDTYTSNVG